MPNTKTKKRNYLSRALGKVVGAAGTALSAPYRGGQVRRRYAYDQTAVNKLMTTVPSTLPKMIRDRAKKAITGYVQKSNYAAARKYIKGLTD